MEVSKCWKMVEFPKVLIKMKNCKTFYEDQAASRINDSPQPVKILLHFWNKNVLTEIYRNIQTFAFKVLQECSSWMWRNDEAKMFYLTPHRKMLAEKFVKWGRFLAVLREHIIFNVEWVEVFWGKLYFKTSELFR